MSGKNKAKISINEGELIRQIAMRPILYDRSLKAYRKLSLRHMYWKQVGDIMGCSVESCRRRWRSLRDSFAKKHKNANRMQIKWKFYKQMMFITPYLENSCGEIDEELLDDFADISNNAEPTNLQTETAQEHFPEEVETESNTAITSSTQTINANIEQKPLNINDDQTQEYTAHAEDHIQEYTAHASASATTHDADSDEKFLLSCAPVLTRLPARKNAWARLKIQQLLYEIEFDDYLNDC